MDNKKRKIMILCIVLAFIISVTLVLCNIFNNDSVDVLLINDNNSGYTDDIPTDNYENENIDDINQDNFKENINSEESSDENISNELVTDNDVFYSEEDVVGYFENIESEVQSCTSFKEKFKEYFILIVDFIFYDGEIKGYRFSELSDSAKAKIVAIALKIDNKIEEYVPNYKEEISSTSSKVYNNVKDRLVSLYMDISVDICTKNKEECNKVKDIFAEIKDVCKIGWSYIKELTSKGVTNLKEWYEVYSGK